MDEHRAERKWRLVADHRERSAKLSELVQMSDFFETRFETLKAGDYLVECTVLIERKAFADLAASIIDGRLFAQAAKLARSSYRALFLIEGPVTEEMAKLHPHALKGAILSVALQWRLPVLFSEGPEDSLYILRMLAEQSQYCRELTLNRPGYKPKRTITKRLYVLQGLPGVGPKLATELLHRFGSVEKVIQASELELIKVPGLGPKKAAAIRAVLD
jgi:Fanconi anemia group M protein